MRTLLSTLALAALMVACSDSEPTPTKDTADAGQESSSPDGGGTNATDDNAKAEPASLPEIKYYVIGEG